MGTVMSQIYGRASKRGQTERDRSRLRGVLRRGQLDACDRRFDVAADDSVIVGDMRYPDTPGLYELIFKRLPDDAVYTENKQTYKSILLTTNAHRPQRACVHSRKQRFQIQAYYRAAIAR
ncbi:hypothetical protein P5V15_015416 [Pogonomyrmex californicus]